VSPHRHAARRQRRSSGGMRRLRRLGPARLGAGLLLLLLRYVAATIPSCSVCDPPDKQASCRKNVPRKVRGVAAWLLVL
jgi:hypothetical protein